jgi:putative ABC transport system ATP-binding protein
MSENETPLVCAERLTKDYRMGRAVINAVRGVSVSVRRGAFSVICGPSGSGKSTLLHLLGCLDRPTSGKLSIAGEDVAAMSDRALSAFRARRLGFIFQTFNLIPVLRAWENVEYPLRINRVPAAESKRRAQEMLEAVGLGEFVDHRPNELSGGQCQRVAIARALVMKPDLVLADEPTANLDSATGERIMALMHELKHKTGTAFVISTHDPMVAAQAEQKLVMHDGELQAND